MFHGCYGSLFLSHATGKGLWLLHISQPTTESVARPNKKYLTAHIWAEAHSLPATGAHCWERGDIFC